MGSWSTTELSNDSSIILCQSSLCDSLAVVVVGAATAVVANSITAMPDAQAVRLSWPRRDPARFNASAAPAATGGSSGASSSTGS
jgi:hypothetical protein